jgi:hypothetical protein
MDQSVQKSTLNPRPRDGGRHNDESRGIEQPAILLTPQEIADLAEADAEIARGELATDEDVRATWSKYDL